MTKIILTRLLIMLDYLYTFINVNVTLTLTVVKKRLQIKRLLQIKRRLQIIKYLQNCYFQKCYCTKYKLSKSPFKSPFFFMCFGKQEAVFEAFPMNFFILF